MPNILNQEARVHGTYLDLPSYLLENRIVFLGPEITKDLTHVVAMQLSALARDTNPVKLYINCSGGSIVDGLAIMDLIDWMRKKTPETPVHTYCFGECIGVATAILAAGQPGSRLALPSARISFYQDWYGVESLWGSQIQDSKERDRLLAQVSQALINHTKPELLVPDKLQSWLKELTFLSVSEAIQTGIVDSVLAAS